MKPWRAAKILALVLAFRGLAGSAGFAAVAVDNEVKFEQVLSKWIVQTDGTWVVEAEVTIRPPAENPSRVVVVPLTWSDSTERLTVTQARIERADGRALDLPPAAMREAPPTGDRYFHEFSDQRRLLITFADVGSTDTLVVRTQRNVFHPRVPGGFMTAPILDRTVGWDETNYTISIPSAMPFKLETRGFEYHAETIIDRRVHYLRATKTDYPAREIAVLSQFDRYPGFSASTFPDWTAFARAYETVLLPRAAVTPPVKALAEKLTQGETDRLKQARLLYDWVRVNIRFIPIPLEETRADPHDAATVAANLYGDAKDHVVLLRALLAAKDIAAEFVLLNASDSSTLAGAPNLRPMNHLVLFLPGPDVYLDSTLGVAPFGVMAFAEYGKSAIFIGGAAPGRRELPIPSSGETISETRTEVALAEDGEVTGTTTTTAQGAFGVWLRNVARSIGPANPAAAAGLLRENGTPGSGAFSFAAPMSGATDYTMRGTFHLQNQSALLNGGFFVPWTGLRILPRPGDFLTGPLAIGNEGRNVPTFCYPGMQSEEITLIVPASRQLGSLPPNLKIETAFLRYQSEWRLSGRKLIVSRMFQSLVKGPVCDGALRRDLLVEMAKIRVDLASPIGLRQEIAGAPAKGEPGNGAPAIGAGAGGAGKR